MTVVSARYMDDGSCELVDVNGVTATWSTAVEWADAWLDEWRRDEHGPASEFMAEMTDRAADGVVPLVTVLADRAAPSADELRWVGAGPLEDLLSHSTNGTVVLGDVDPQVRSRLAVLGARDRAAPDG